MIMEAFQSENQSGAAWAENIGGVFIVIPIILIMANMFTCGALFNAWFNWSWFKNGCAGNDED